MGGWGRLGGWGRWGGWGDGGDGEMGEMGEMNWTISQRSGSILLPTIEREQDAPTSEFSGHHDLDLL